MVVRLLLASPNLFEKVEYPALCVSRYLAVKPVLDPGAAEIDLRIAVEMRAVPAVGGVRINVPFHRSALPGGGFEFRHAQV